MDVATATDQELFDAVVQLIAAYVEGLTFAMNANGAFNLSPYDAFLAANGLPRQPNSGESDQAYTTRLRTALDKLTSPVFILDDGETQTFEFHSQPFNFGEQELRGLRVFLARQPGGPRLSSGVGNCAACHAAPHFTDFKVHNTGVNQFEYDALHGDGSFAALAIPSLAARNADYNAYLPATPNHPLASERFRAVADADDASLTDLGVWNVYATPDLPGPQTRLKTFLCDVAPGTDCGSIDDDSLLTRAIASFKTPGLRDLGHSGPYMHNGAFETIEAAVRFYRDASEMARGATLRNADPRLDDIALNADDIADLTAFLKALNEDYE
ncbi:cytochrome c peroxidase [Thiohalobacter thiocyanaticus]|uniref:Cytochrome c peroxidase n=1 Tax=Thiohalobacter thiocyanaticus TaxID=585455 RepID=A0A1Z4VUJ0_9GAMM|nr:cytochrome c peroxidase [Thiohalobacter thiocyanaticus]